MGYVNKISPDNGTTNYAVSHGLFGTCTTGSATQNKIVTLPDLDDLKTGTIIFVSFLWSNTHYTPKLNVNNLGLKDVYVESSQTCIGIGSNSVEIFSFDEDLDAWVWISSDTKVYQHQSTVNFEQFVLLSSTSSDSVSSVVKNPTLKYNPSTKEFSTGGSINGYTLGAACEKGIGSVSQGNTDLVTGGDVFAAIQTGGSGALVYIGTVSADSGFGTTYKKGYFWYAGSTATTLAGKAVEPGDMIIAKQDYSGTIANDMDIIQGNVLRITNAEIDTILATAAA